MKKKLLLSSVAALTLFTAYNTASAETTGFGSDVDSALSLIDKATTTTEVNDAAAKAKAVFPSAQKVRKANRALQNAKKTEAQAFENYQKAQQDQAKAAQDLREATDKKSDATALKTKLEATKKKYQDASTEAGNNLTKAKAAQTTAQSDVDTKQTAVDKAKAALDAQLNENQPVSGSDAATLKKYAKDTENLRAALTSATEDLMDAQDALEAAKADVKKYTDEQKANDDAVKAIDKALTALDPIANDDSSLGDAAVSALTDVLTKKTAATKTAQDAYVAAGSNVRNAQSDFDTEVTAAKKVYADNKVAFNLDEILTPAQEVTGKTGWKPTDAGWQYLDSRLEAVKGWVNDNGTWYYTDQNGIMKKWWVKVDGKWYFLNGSGAMQTGWLLDTNGKWYFLDASGAMKENQWFEVNGKWYYVNGSGELAVNTTVNGYTVNENGEWVK